VRAAAGGRLNRPDVQGGAGVERDLPEDVRRIQAEVARCLRQHAEEHPELADAVAAYVLFRTEFRHTCLNRLQLRNTLEMVDISDQAETLLYAGTLDSPIA
jgi:siderophore synthetase component